MKNNKGFTLIEMIISIAIFGFFMIVVINIFSFISQIQRNNLDSQKFYAGIYEIIDNIKLNVKNGYVDYDYYKTIDYDIDTPENILAITNDYGTSVIYKLGNESCYAGTNLCIEKSIDNGLTWLNITPKNIEITKLDFYISPRSDSFKLPPQSIADCKYSYVNSTCPCTTDYDCFKDQKCEAQKCVNSKGMSFITIVLRGGYKKNDKIIENFDYQNSIEVKKYLKWF